MSGLSIPRRSSVHAAASSGSNFDVDKNDIVIAIMGATGSGKSSLINRAAGKTEVAIGYGLKSETRKVEPIRCFHPDRHRNVVLVDTPGFDGMHVSDDFVLKIIARWLKETYQNEIKLTGILYLHRISDDRVTGTALKNLSAFRSLCGDDNLKNVVLVTTMWDEVEESVGLWRERELQSDFWRAMLNLGSCTRRFQGTRSSAWEIIDGLDMEGTSRRRTQLQIQQEMVDCRLPFEKTAAAQALLGFVKGAKWAWKGLHQVFCAGNPSRSMQRQDTFTSKSSGLERSDV